MDTNIELDVKPSTTEHPLYESVVNACKSIYDPEVPVNIYDLGLIYTITINEDKTVDVIMTLTAPGCPVAGEMPIWVEDAISAIPEIISTKVEMTFEPQWGLDKMSDEAQLELGLI